MAHRNECSPEGRKASYRNSGLHCGRGRNIWCEIKCEELKGDWKKERLAWPFPSMQSEGEQNSWIHRRKTNIQSRIFVRVNHHHNQYLLWSVTSHIPQIKTNFKETHWILSIKEPTFKRNNKEEDTEGKGAIFIQDYLFINWLIYMLSFTCTVKILLLIIQPQLPVAEAVENVIWRARGASGQVSDAAGAAVGAPRFGGCWLPCAGCIRLAAQHLRPSVGARGPTGN